MENQNTKILNERGEKKMSNKTRDWLTCWIETETNKVDVSAKEQKLTQPQLAGLCNVGVRFIVDLESGKETCQIGKVLYVLDMLGIKLKIDGENQ